MPKLKAGTRILYTDDYCKRMIGYYRIPANVRGYLVVTRDKHGSQCDVIHKTDIIAVA